MPINDRAPIASWDWPGLVGLLFFMLMLCWTVMSHFPVRQQEVPFTDNALQHAKKAKQALTRMEEGLSSFSRGDYLQAEKVFSAIAADLPDVKHAAAMASFLDVPNARMYRRIVSALYSNLGLAQLRSRQYEQAQRSLRKAISIDPYADQPRRNLGITYLRQKQFSSALNELESSLRYGSGDAKLYVNLGESHLGLGHHDKARWAFLQAKRLSKPVNNPMQWGELLEAERGLAKVYFREGRLAYSKRYLQDLLTRAPGDSEGRYLLVQVLARQGHEQQAAVHKARFDRDSQIIADVQHVLSSTPGKVDALQWVADTYRELGLLHLAYVHYQQLRSRDPADSKVQLAIIKLQQRIKDRS